MKMANDTHYGLAAFVWGRDIAVALRTAHQLEAGWIQVNQAGGPAAGHSYGGYKQSGIGKEYSLEAMLDSYTLTKNVVVNPRAVRNIRERVGKMSVATLTRASIEALAQFDTASVCNALEVLRPEYRSSGFTRLPLIAARPSLKPVVGVAGSPG